MTPDDLLRQTGLINPPNVPHRTLVLKDLKLDGINWSRRFLVGLAFENCSLRFADFTACDLSHCRFVDCDLYRANFGRSVLYTCWFINSDMTRADFAAAKLSGFRLRNVDVTQTSFGLEEELVLGANRRTLNEVPTGASGVRTNELGDLIDLSTYEIGVNYVVAKDAGLVIHIARDPLSESWRQARRSSEAYRYLKQMFASNGDLDSAYRCHYLEHVSKRRASRSWLYRLADWFFGDLLSGYGTNWRKCIRSLILLTLITTGFYALMPHFGGSIVFDSAGYKLQLTAATDFSGVMRTLGDAVYFSMMQTTLVGATGYTVTGTAKGVVLIHTLLAAFMLGSTLATIFRRFTRA
jgi:hypothetical protein